MPKAVSGGSRAVPVGLVLYDELGQPSISVDGVGVNQVFVVQFILKPEANVEYSYEIERVEATNHGVRYRSFGAYQTRREYLKSVALQC